MKRIWNVPDETLERLLLYLYVGLSIVVLIACGIGLYFYWTGAERMGMMCQKFAGGVGIFLCLVGIVRLLILDRME